MMGLIKHVHDVINLLYYLLRTATLPHDVCDVHGAFSLYIKTCWQSLYKGFPTGGMGESPHEAKVCSFTPSPPNFYSLPPVYCSNIVYSII